MVAPDTLTFSPALVSNGIRRLILSGPGQLDGLPGSVIFSPIGGGLFGVTQFDAAAGFVGRSGTINVTGLRADNSTVQQSFAVSDQFATFALPGSFRDLVSIRFAEPGLLAFRAQGLALDNVRLAGAGAVPEPASWLMLIAGFGLVGTMARRRALAG